MPLISVANVACGFHASDFNHMRKTVKLAKAHGVMVGAHPSLRDDQTAIVVVIEVRVELRDQRVTARAIDA
jgi:lactam utilization protein B